MKQTIVVTLLACSCAGPHQAERLDGPPAQAIVEVAVETFEGRVASRQGEPGSKSEGEQWLVLEVDEDVGGDVVVGGHFELENPGDLKAGERVTVRARRVTLSPFAAHRPGPRLMVVEVIRR